MSTMTRVADEVYTQKDPSASTGTTAKLAATRPTVTLALDGVSVLGDRVEQRSAITKLELAASVNVRFTKTAEAPAGAFNLIIAPGRKTSAQSVTHLRVSTKPVSYTHLTLPTSDLV